MTNATAATLVTPLEFNLFDMTPATDCINHIRAATDDECKAYLCDVARRAGLPTDGRVSLVASMTRRGRGGDRVIYGLTVGTSYSIPMPGLNQSRTVVMETLDDAGQVIATVKSATTHNGKLSIPREAVRAAVGPIERVRATRRPRAAAVVPVAPVVHASAADAVRAGAYDAPMHDDAPAPAPAAVEASPDVAALVLRLVALETMVARLARPAGRVRSEVERRAILRAWRFRCEARERADLDRRALDAANGAYRGALDVIGAHIDEAAALRADLASMTEQAANARRAATDYKREMETAAASLDRTIARRRDTAAALIRARRTAVVARGEAFQAGRRAQQAEIALTGAQLASAAAWERVAALQIDRLAVAA